MTTLKAVKSLNDSDILYNNTVLSKNYPLRRQIEDTNEYGDRRHQYLNTLLTHFNQKLSQLCVDYNFQNFWRLFLAYDPIFGFATSLLNRSTENFRNYVYMKMFEHFVEHIDSYSPDKQKEFFDRLAKYQYEGLYNVTSEIATRLENELLDKVPPTLITLCFGNTNTKFYHAYKTSKKVYKKYLSSIENDDDNLYEFLKDCAKSAWIRDGCKVEMYCEYNFNIFRKEFPKKIVYGKEEELEY